MVPLETDTKQQTLSSLPHRLNTASSIYTPLHFFEIFDINEMFLGKVIETTYRKHYLSSISNYYITCSSDESGEISDENS